MRRREESGQLLILICIYTLVAAFVLAVAVDASSVFLRRRALVAAADGAALAAAQSLDEAAFYRHGSRNSLPLDRAGAAAAVRRYVVANRLSNRFTSFRVTSVRLSPDGRTIEVSVHCVVRLPFTGPFVGSATRIPISATAAADAPTG
jgi:uncharacterized membrane protein